MFPGESSYGEQFRPERGQLHNWQVWNESGALEVLKLREFEAPGSAEPYTIIFANGSAARLVKRDAIWCELADIAACYSVDVFPLSLSSGGYVPWSIGDDAPLCFDAIKIGRPRRSEQ